MGQSLIKNDLQVSDSSLDSVQHFSSLSSLLWTGVESSSESLTDLLHSVAELLALEEDDEDALEQRLTLQTNTFETTPDDDIVI